MIPICIQTIENDDDRDFMEWLFLEYHPLMYATIRKVIHDQWTCEDVLQESVRKFIDHIPQLREMDAASRTNYIVVACRYNAIEEEKRQRRAPFPVGNGVIDIASRDAEDPERQILLLDDADVLWRVWPAAGFADAAAAGGQICPEHERCGDCLWPGCQAQQCADAADKGQEQGA